MTAHPASAWTLRTAVVAGAWCDLTAVHLAGGDVPLWLWAAVSCAAIAAAAWPASLGPLLALGSMLAAWLAVPGGTPSAWVLLGAGGVVVTHVAALLLGGAPPGAAVPMALVRSWARRCSLVWLSSAVVWASARLVAAPTGSVAASARVSALVVLGLGAVWLSIKLGKIKPDTAG